MKRMKISIVVATAALLLSVFLVAPTSASDHCVDVGGYTICFLGAEDLGGGESQWTYSVTSDSTEGNALSHWTLELCSGFQDSVDPGNGDTYRMPTYPLYGIVQNARSSSFTHFRLATACRLWFLLCRRIVGLRRRLQEHAQKGEENADHCAQHSSNQAQPQPAACICDLHWSSGY